MTTPLVELVRAGSLLKISETRGRSIISLTSQGSGCNYFTGSRDWFIGTKNIQRKQWSLLIQNTIGRHPIDLFHNGGQIKYLSVLMLISLSSIAMTSKFQKNFCFKMRAVRLININRWSPLPALRTWRL